MNEPGGFNIGDVVRKLRHRRQWTIEQLAKEAGLNKATISSLERGASNFTKDTIDKLAHAFGFTAGDELLLESTQTLATPDVLRVRLWSVWETIAPEHRPAALHEVERVAALSIEIQRLSAAMLQRDARELNDVVRTQRDDDRLRLLDAEVKRLRAGAERGTGPRRRRNRRLG